MRLLDQRKLPNRIEYFTARNARDVHFAIREMVVRGAPLIGVVAAWGIVVEAQRMSDRELATGLRHALKLIRRARPTAQNLFWACDRMDAALARYARDARRTRQEIMAEAKRIEAEDVVSCERIGEHGAGLIKDRAKIMVYCNAGALATAGIGTALGVLYKAQARGRRFTVYACETRPLLQGARLTAWELHQNGVKTVLVCDNMAASFVGGMDLVLVGADRIAANGDVANKIGTRGLAMITRYHHIPFYVAAPWSTFDPKIKDGSSIPIEYRRESEVKEVCGRLVAPRAVPALNPAFDITPGRLVTGIITDQGLVRAPYGRSIQRMRSRL